MGTCCSKKPRQNQDQLLEVHRPNAGSLQNSSQSSLRVDGYGMNSRSSVKRENVGEINRKGDGSLGYNPPVVSSGREKSPPRRLSLSTCPAQVRSGPLIFPPVKYGELKKMGHVIKNWKKRFFVLEGDKLQYYGIGKANPDASRFKGEMDLEGAEIYEDNENMRITIRNGSADIVLECDSLNLMTEWKYAIKDCIRTANCNSLIKGQRVESVVEWYEAQYTLYANAATVMRNGSMFCLHYVHPTDGYDELIPIWLQENSSGQGLLLRCYNVNYHTTAAPTVAGTDLSTPDTAARSRIEGLEILYHDITSIMTGCKTEVYHTPEMGGSNTTFLTFGTISDTFILEAKSRIVRDHWAACIRDLINFIHIPIPGERTAEQAPKKTSGISRKNSRTPYREDSD